MIRWNQAKIHKERREREDQLALLKMEYEATVNFLTFIKEQLKNGQVGSVSTIMNISQVKLGHLAGINRQRGLQRHGY